MNRQPHSQLSQWYECFERGRIVRYLETFQNLIVICLCIGLFCMMAIQLGEIFLSLVRPLAFPEVTSNILFLLILVELFRLLIIYLQEQRISVGVAVEVSIVSVLREVMIRGVLEIPWIQILATCAFLIVLGVLLLIRAWMSQIFNAIEPDNRAIGNNQVVSEGNQLADREHSFQWDQQI